MRQCKLCSCLIKHHCATNSLSINQSFFGQQSKLKGKNFMGNCLTFHVDQRLLYNIYCRFYWPLNTDYTDNKQIDLLWHFYTATSRMTFIKNATTELTDSAFTTVHSLARRDVPFITKGMIAVFQSNYTIESFTNIQLPFKMCSSKVYSP